MRVAQLTIDGWEVPIVAPPAKHGKAERLFAAPEAPAGSLALELDEGDKVERTFGNGSGPEWARLLEWIEGHPGSTARVVSRTPYHVGSLGATRSHRIGGGERATIRVRDDRKGARGQYRTVFDIDHLQIKVGQRYVAAREVIG